MGRISKFTVDQKVQAVLDYKNGERKIKEICQDLGIHSSGKAIYQWVVQYETFGEKAFERKKRNTQYSQEIKKAAIKDYLAKVGSYQDIAKKYRVSSPSIVEKWVLKYEVEHDAEKKMKRNNKMNEEGKVLKKLREENQQLKRQMRLKEKENMLLKQMEMVKLDGVKQKAKYVVIQDLHERHRWSINWMCQVLDVTRAGYYKWLERRAEKERMINTKIA